MDHNGPIHNLQAVILDRPFGQWYNGPYQKHKIGLSIWTLHYLWCWVAIMDRPKLCMSNVDFDFQNKQCTALHKWFVRN